MIPGPLARGVRAAALALACSLLWACGQAPELAREHLKRGDAALAEGRYAQALVAYTHAREVAPADPGVQRAIMRTRMHLIAESPARVGPDGFEEARYEASFLIDADPARAPVYLTVLGNVLARQGERAERRGKFAEALKIDPTSPLAHTALGIVLMSRKDGAAQAKVEFELALSAKPDGVGALIGLGELELAGGDLPGAAERLEAALRVSDDFTARMALGNVRVQQRRPAEAAEQFQRAVRLDPKNADALGALGQALLGAGRPEDAERAIRAATQIRADGALSIALGFALARQKKSEPALGVFSQILTQDPHAATALYGAGSVSEELGRREQALDFYRRLLALPPEGQQRQALADLQREAQTRVTALSAGPPPAAASSAAQPPKR